MAIESSVNVLDVVSQKTTAYFNEVSKYTQRLYNDTSNVFRAGEVTDFITKTVEFIRDNEIMTIPSKIVANSRFRTDIYNSIIESIKVDTQVSFSRIRALEETINHTAAVINNTTYSMLADIDVMLDKIANLSNLKNIHNNYDDIVFNTFIENNNTNHSVDRRCKHGESGGIITLKNISFDDFSDKGNYSLNIEPLNKNTNLTIYSSTLNNDNMTDALDVSVYSRNALYISDFNIGFQFNDPNSIKSLSYNGCATAIIINFPSIRLINHLAMKFASAGLLDIIDVLYSPRNSFSVAGGEWYSIPFEIDNNNIRGTEINFETIQSSAIMMVVGQKLTKELSIQSKNEINTDKFKLSEMLDLLERNNNVVTKSKLKEFVNDQITKDLNEDTTNILNSILMYLYSMLPADENDELNFTKVLSYNISIYDFELQYIHYYNNSVFKSDRLGGKGDIENIMITANGKDQMVTTFDNDIVAGIEVSTDTVSNFYIETENGEHRIIPSGEPYIRDVITVTDISVSTYYLEKLANANNGKYFEVFINNVKTGAYSQEVSNNICYGITVGIELTFGDTILIIYEPADVDSLSNVYNPYEIKMDDILGNPVIVNQNLKNGNNDRGIIKLFSEIDNEYYHSVVNLGSDGLQFVEAPDTISGIIDYNYAVPSGYVGLNTDHLISGIIGDSEIYINDEYVKSGNNIIYGGIINESLTINATSGSTDLPYLPGTLHAIFNNNLIKVNEYGTISGDIDNFNTFTFNENISGTILLSYIPYEISDLESSNISNFNANELFQGTTSEATIDLDKVPYLDFNILQDSANAKSIWTNSRGRFINKRNENIVYYPIKIVIDGRTIENLTDYYTGNEPEFATYNPLLYNYQYYIKNNVVKFNTPISGKNIYVSYYRRNDEFKLIAKQYRLNRKRDDLTPELYGYGIYMNKRDN